jgi:hypothetical protein
MKYSQAPGIRTERGAVVMNSLAQSLIGASIIYDERHREEKLRRTYLPDLYIPRSRQTDYVVFMMCGNVLNVVIRGTDGDGPLQKIASWLSDFDMKPDETGCHTGFKEAAEWIFHKFEDTPIDKSAVRSVRIVCHSRGTGIGVILETMLAEFFKDQAQVNIDLFAPVPGFTNKGVREIWNPCHAKYGITAWVVKNPRDIFAYSFRGKEDDDGADVEAGAALMELPPDSVVQRLFKRVNGVVEHQCTEYCDGMIKYYSRHPETVAYLRAGRKMMV